MGRLRLSCFQIKHLVTLSVPAIEFASGAFLLELKVPQSVIALTCGLTYPLPLKAAGPGKSFRPSRRAIRDGLFVTPATPVDKNQRAALCGGLLSNQQAMSACLSSALCSPRLCRGFFYASSSTQKKRDRWLAWQRPLPY